MVVSYAFTRSQLSATLLSALRVLLTVPGLYVGGKVCIVMLIQMYHMQASKLDMSYPRGYTSRFIVLGVVLIPIIGYIFMFGIYFTSCTSSCCVCVISHEQLSMQQ